MPGRRRYGESCRYHCVILFACAVRLLACFRLVFGFALQCVVIARGITGYISSLFSLASGLWRFVSDLFMSCLTCSGGRVRWRVEEFQAERRTDREVFLTIVSDLIAVRLHASHFIFQLYQYPIICSSATPSGSMLQPELFAACWHGATISDSQVRRMLSARSAATRCNR